MKNTKLLFGIMIDTDMSENKRKQTIKIGETNYVKNYWY